MSELTKAQQLRARKEMVRQKQQAAIEKRDMRTNATRSENIRRRKNAAEKMGKKYSHTDATTPSVEVGPINYGSPMKKSSCIKMYDSKGKPAGLMAEGSMAYMESIGQEKNNLMQDMPIDNRGVSQMSPYKMDHGSPAKETDPKLNKALERAKAKAAQLQAQKSADSVQFEKNYEKMLGESANVFSVGENANEKIKKRAQDVTKQAYDFDIIKPTKQFPQTGASVKKGSYLGSGYVTADGREAGFGNSMTVSELVEDTPRSGFEQTKARKISKLLGLNKK